LRKRKFLKRKETTSFLRSKKRSERNSILGEKCRPAPGHQGGRRQIDGTITEKYRKKTAFQKKEKESPYTMAKRGIPGGLQVGRGGRDDYSRESDPHLENWVATGASRGEREKGGGKGSLGKGGNVMVVRSRKKGRNPTKKGAYSPHTPKLRPRWRSGTSLLWGESPSSNCLGGGSRWFFHFYKRAT